MTFSLKQIGTGGKGACVNLIGLVSLLPLVAISGLAQIIVPAILARVPGWRVPEGAPVLIPRSGLAAYWLAQGAVVAFAAFIAARIWHGDGCVSGVTGSPLCETLGETAGRRLQAVSLIAALVAVGAPVGGLIAALAERAARQRAALAKAGSRG